MILEKFEFQMVSGVGLGVKRPRRIRARLVLDRYFEPCYVAPTEGVLGKNLLEIEVDSMKPHVKPKVPSKDYSLISLLGRDFPTGETHR